MKSPMNMAPTKFNERLEQAKADGKLNPEFASVIPMKSPMQMSPAKMGSAYKMDKSAFKLKSAPVNMNTPGSVAKLAGVSPMKNLTPEVNVSGGKKNVRTDVTEKYKTQGNKSTREHIKKGGTVHENSDGSLSLSRKA